MRALARPLRRLARPARAAVLGLVAALAASCGGDAPPDPAAGGPTPPPGGPAPLVVGLEAAYPPFESTDATGAIVGFDVDLVRAFARSLGREAEFRNMAFDALIPELQAGRIDMVCSGMSYTEERAKTVDFSRPYARTTMSVLVSRERAGDVESIAALDAEGVVIAVHRGTTGESKARRAFPRATVEPYDNQVDAAAQVEAGRAHAFVYDLVSVTKLAAKAPERLRVLEGDLGGEDYCMVFRKGSPLVASSRAFLEEVSAPGGEIDRLVARWELTAEPVRPDER